MKNYVMFSLLAVVASASAMEDNNDQGWWEYMFGANAVQAPAQIVPGSNEENAKRHLGIAKTHERELGSAINEDNLNRRVTNANEILDVVMRDGSSTQQAEARALRVAVEAKAAAKRISKDWAPVPVNVMRNPQQQPMMRSQQQPMVRSQQPAATTRTHNPNRTATGKMKNDKMDCSSGTCKVKKNCSGGSCSRNK